MKKLNEENPEIYGLLKAIFVTDSNYRIDYVKLLKHPFFDTFIGDQFNEFHLFRNN